MNSVKLIRADNPERRLFRCGHKGPRSFFIKVFRNAEEMTSDEKCPECAVEFLEKFAIPCSGCYRPIIPGKLVMEIGSEIFCLHKMCRPGNHSGIWTGVSVWHEQASSAK